MDEGSIYLASYFQWGRPGNEWVGVGDTGLVETCRSLQIQSETKFSKIERTCGDLISWDEQCKNNRERGKGDRGHAVNVRCSVHVACFAFTCNQY